MLSGHNLMVKLKKSSVIYELYSKKRKFVIVFCAFFIIILCGIVYKDYLTNKSIEENINLGTRYLYAKQYEQAIESFNRAIELDSKSVEGMNGLSEVYLAKHEYSKSEDILKKALKLLPQNKEIKNQLIKVYIEEGKDFLSSEKKEEAKERFDKAIEVDNMNEGTYIVLADSYLSKEYNYESLQVLKKGYSNTNSRVLKSKMDELIKSFRGNSANNISNGGYAVKQDEWVYYCNYSDNRYLYKIKENGSEKVKLSNDECSYINVIDDWIYYVTKNKEIHKVKIDGTKDRIIRDSDDDKKFIIDDVENSNDDEEIKSSIIDELNSNKTYCHISKLTVLGDKIYYYIDYDPRIAAYVIELDNNGKKLREFKLTMPWHGFAIEDNYIYSWQGRTGIGGDAFRINLDGKLEHETIAKSQYADQIRFTGKDIYYCVTSDDLSKSFMRLFRVDKNLSNSTEITLTDSENRFDLVDGINIDKDYIYYSKDNGIYRMKVDGSNKVKLSNSQAHYINIAGDWIYYTVIDLTKPYNEEEKYEKIYRMRIDGTKNELVN